MQVESRGLGIDATRSTLSPPIRPAFAAPRSPAEVPVWFFFLWDLNIVSDFEFRVLDSSKLEARNPKQIQNLKRQTKRHRVCKHPKPQTLRTGSILRFSKLPDWSKLRRPAKYAVRRSAAD
jgi:hypothetical protein